MSELRHDPWVPFREAATTGSSLAELAELAELAVGGIGPSPLHVVPDLPRQLGAGVLGREADFDQELVLVRRLQVTPDVVTLVLAPTVAGGAFAFRPGQFLTVVAEVDGTPVERCYTISSPPTRPHLLTITVKRTAGGTLSPYLHDRLAVGGRLRAHGPHGVFTIASHPAARYLLLSAGSGVTPTLATVRTLADLGELGEPGPDGAGGTDVVVVHAARTPADRVCAAELDALAATHPGLRVVWVCEDDDPARPGAWTGPRGRLDAALLTSAVPDLHEREVLTCGPPGYMAATRRLLAELGADPARCHEESFVLGDPAGPLLATPADDEVRGAGIGAEASSATDGGAAVPSATATATVRFGRSGREVPCPPGTTVLQAAAQAGVFLPSSCSAGLCGTCKSGLLSGRVEMNHQGGIRPREIAQDKFLPCCSTPDGDIVVDA